MLLGASRRLDEGTRRCARGPPAELHADSNSLSRASALTCVGRALLAGCRDSPLASKHDEMAASEKGECSARAFGGGRSKVGAE